MNTVTIDQALRLALEHHNHGRLREAEAIYRQILQVQHRNPAALYLLGMVHRTDGRLEEAVDCLHQAVDAQPDHVDALVALGAALKELGRSAEAGNAYQRAAIQAPQNIQAITGALASLQVQAVQAVDSAHGPIRFLCSDHLPLYRAQTLLTKEPETLTWIEAFDEGDVFWDVGANVGVYTLYAAKVGKAGRILAFEPSAGNYMLLNRNIELNGVDHSTRAYCLAFSDGDQVDDLHMQNTELGGALSSFASAVDHNGQAFKAKFRQGMIGFSIDSFIQLFTPPFPNRLKIDVDGIEDRIIAGATATLADLRLKALSVELDDARPDYTNAVIAMIEAGGMVLTAKRHAPMFDGSPYANIYNFHFARV